MPTYRYTCLDAHTGAESTGVIDGTGPAETVAALKARGLHPIALVAAAETAEPLNAAPSTPKRRRSVRLSRTDLTPFTRQLASLLKAGMPLVRGLDLLARQANPRGSGPAIRALAEAVRGGASLSAAMAADPRSFPPAYVAMVRAGEAGGVIEVVVERLGHFLDKRDRLVRRVRSALVYPAMIALVAGGVVTALMMFVVPKFEAVFVSMLKGQPLPALTELVLGVGKVLQHHGALVAAAPVAAGMAWVFARRLRRVRRWWDGTLLSLPALGGVATKAAVAHLCRTLGTLLASGVPLLPALLITRDTAGNLRIAEALTVIHDRVQAGDAIAPPFAAASVFPPLVPGMIEVGEETGSLAEMLLRVAETYEDEVDATVAGLTSLLEPVTIAAMAVVVGTIVIAMFLPIVKLIQTLS